MTKCVHHWLLSAPQNNFHDGTVTTHYRCKKCGLEEDRTTKAFTGSSEPFIPEYNEVVPDGFHIIEWND
jgi:hypothetical protein